MSRRIAPADVPAALSAANSDGDGISAAAQLRTPLARNQQQSGPERILIVRLGSMGDIVHSLPAVSALRHAFPQVRIDWIVEERWAELLCSRAELREGPRGPEKPLVDVVRVVDTRAWRGALLAPQTRASIAGVLRALRGAQYDLAIDLQSAVKSALLAQASRAPRRFGFQRPIEWPASLFYTRRVEATGRHMVQQNVSLIMAAIAAAGGEIRTLHAFDFPLPRDPRHDEWVAGELRQRGIGGFVLLNPGAGWGAKCWPADRFAQVARELARDRNNAARELAGSGLRSLVNFGPGEEELARSVVEQSEGAAQAVNCSIGQLIALTRRARLCVGGDTGPTHLAAALGIPVVGIHGPTDPARNGPFGARLPADNIAVLRSAASVTSHSRRAQPEAGLMSITAAEVVASARRLLQNAATRERA